MLTIRGIRVDVMEWPQPARLTVLTSPEGQVALVFQLPDDDGMAYEFNNPDDIERLVHSLMDAHSLMLYNRAANRIQSIKQSIEDGELAISDIETNIMHKGDNPIEG